MDVLQLRAAVDEPQIERLVADFYGRARLDPLLGPIFEQLVPAERWASHIEKIVEFWSTALRGTGRYRANPIDAHRGIDRLSVLHFDRWLELWNETARDIFEPEVAAAVYQRAERMAGHMQRQLIAQPS